MKGSYALRNISPMQNSHVITTRKDGVRVIVKVRNPGIFAIVDRVGDILRNQMEEQKKWVRSL